MKLFLAALACLGVFVAADITVNALASGATFYVSTVGNDANPCTQTAPCKTFQRGYAIAKPGDTVEIAAGTYASQYVGGVSKSSGPRVVFRPPAGAKASVKCGTTVQNGVTISGQSCLDVAVSHVEFRDLTTPTYTTQGFAYQGRFDTERGINDVVFDHIDVGAVILVSDDEHVLNSDLGPSVDPFNSRCCGASSNSWKNNRFHDYRIKNGGHFECVTWDGGNATFDGNQFSGCDVFAIFAKPVDNIDGAVINNTFAPDPATNQDLKIVCGADGSGATRADVRVSGNAFANGTFFDCPGVTTGDPPPVTTTTPAYSPACATTCDEQIADLRSRLDAWAAWEAKHP